MPYVNYDQSNFTKGVLDPRAYARTDWEGYYQSAKTINNALVIPQGGVQRRWGTTYVATLDATLNPIAHPEWTEISTLTYDDLAIYLLVWEAGFVLIYLENVLVATVATPYLNVDIVGLRPTQVINRIVVAAGHLIPPYQLVRSANAPTNITAFSAINNTITIVAAVTPGQVLPVTFQTGGALPTTIPQIVANRIYFLFAVTANTVQIYATPDDAAAQTNMFQVTALGAASTATIQNTWAFTQINFIYVPTYDFNGGYSALTFTPSATTGNAVTITASAPIFTAAMVGGVFTGNGGILRIQVFNSNVIVTGFVETPFTNTNAIPGSVSFLGEPAWSATRGYPRFSGFFQNRLVFAGTFTLPNGVWLSAVNAAFDFDDSEALPDSAISWYPASGQTNVIKAITAGRTLIIHTNTGNYSTPFATEVPLTPLNFVLTEQNKDGVSDLQPVFIDNQIIYIDKSGNNVKNMLWEITQSSYVLNNISISSSFLIKQPVDMTAFTDPQFTDGYYVIFVNRDGTLAIFQTLHEQEIAAFTSADQLDYQGLVSSSAGGYQHVTSSIGKVWFIVKRDANINNAPTAITGFSAVNNTLHSVAHGLPIGIGSQIYFTTGGVLPLTVPPLNLTQYFYAIATDANNFQVFGSAIDATVNQNAFTIVNAGAASNVIYSVAHTNQYIEYLDFNVPSDAAIKFTNINSNVIGGLNIHNGVDVAVYADGVSQGIFNVFNNTVTLPQVVQTGTAGALFVSTLQLLPIGNIPGTPSNLYKTKHIRGFYINVFNTLGATIQGQPIIIPAPIPLLTVPRSGVYLYGMMEDWDFNAYDVTIQQVNPLPMTILGVSYILELT